MESKRVFDTKLNSIENRKEIVDFLCKNGASVNYQDTRGWTVNLQNYHYLC